MLTNAPPGCGVWRFPAVLFFFLFDSIKAALTDENRGYRAEAFHAALKEHKVVVADFYAVWCGDCKMIDPFFNKCV